MYARQPTVAGSARVRASTDGRWLGGAFVCSVEVGEVACFQRHQDRRSVGVDPDGWDFPVQPVSVSDDLYAVVGLLRVSVTRFLRPLLRPLWS